MEQTDTTWVALRRPLLVAFVFGCAISLMDSGRLTLRLALPASIYWMFVPLLEIVSLFAASRAARRTRPWQRTIDLFFQGHAPWLLWLIAFSAYWAFLPTVTAFTWPGRDRVWLYSAGLVAAWSAYVDFRFFRAALACTRRQAVRDLLLQRILSWTAALAIFLGPPGYQVIASRLGL
jgi:hypothetical protein